MANSWNVVSANNSFGNVWLIKMHERQAGSRQMDRQTDSQWDRQRDGGRKREGCDHCLHQLANELCETIKIPCVMATLTVVLKEVKTMQTKSTGSIATFLTNSFVPYSLSYAQTNLPLSHHRMKGKLCKVHSQLSKHFTLIHTKCVW